jgi:hypothetical protein
MKKIILVAVLMSCASVHANLPHYEQMRDSVLKLCMTNTVPNDERVLVGHGSDYVNSPADYGLILRHHKGMNLREIIDETPYKGKRVYIWVYREHESESSHGFMGDVKPADKPDYEVMPFDLVWIYTGHPII